MSLTELQQLAVDHPQIKGVLEQLNERIEELTADDDISLSDTVTLETIVGILAEQISQIEGYERGVSITLTDGRIGRDEYAQSIQIEAQTELSPGHERMIIFSLETDLENIDRHIEQQASLDDSTHQKTFYAAADGTIADGPEGNDLNLETPKIV